MSWFCDYRRKSLAYNSNLKIGDFLRVLIKFLGENPIFRIVDFLIENKGLEVTKKEIIEGTGLARATLFKFWPQIESQEIVSVTRKFGKTKLYTLNSKNPIIKKILEMKSILIGKAIDKNKLFTTKTEEKSRALVVREGVHVELSQQGFFQNFVEN